MKLISQKFNQIFQNYDWKVWFKVGTILLLIALIAFDQSMKQLALHRLNDDRIHPLLPGFINLELTINYGTAFGLNQKRTVLIITVAILISLILIIWWIFSSSKINLIGVTFILSGTLGNLIDRAYHNGGVVDFLRWELFLKSIFNTADTFITIGIVVIILGLLIREIILHREEKALKRQEQIKNV